MRPFAVLLDAAALADFCDFNAAFRRLTWRCGLSRLLRFLRSLLLRHMASSSKSIASGIYLIETRRDLLLFCVLISKRKILCDVLRPKYFSDEDSQFSILFSGESNSFINFQSPIKKPYPCKEKGCIVRVIHTSWVVATKIVDVPRSRYGVAVKILEPEWSRSTRRYDQERTFPFALQFAYQISISFPSKHEMTWLYIPKLDFSVPPLSCFCLVSLNVV